MYDDNIKRNNGQVSLERQKDFIKKLADMVTDKDDGGSLLYFSGKPKKQEKQNISLHDLCAYMTIFLKDEFEAETTFIENGKIIMRFSGGQEFRLKIEKKAE